MTRVQFVRAIPERVGTVVAGALAAAVRARPLRVERLILVAVAVRKERAAIVAALHLFRDYGADQLAGNLLAGVVRRTDMEAITHGSSLNTIRHTSTG